MCNKSRCSACKVTEEESQHFNFVGMLLDDSGVSFWFLISLHVTSQVVTKTVKLSESSDIRHLNNIKRDTQRLMCTWANLHNCPQLCNDGMSSWCACALQPQYLFSPTSVLRSQRATCVESATLLCSLLLGANYDAYCVLGYASREMCLVDQSLQECPLLGVEVGAAPSHIWNRALSEPSTGTSFSLGRPDQGENVPENIAQ